ncbi:ATP-binding protein [Flexivirga alba]|uniref:ATP-binding protein n=1 Tax=Flexivirga alba TaxID=702742 RepID=A0ABW2AHM0_9MICO
MPEPPQVPARPASAVVVPDLADIVGQEEARYGLEVAAAGGHHLAMVGPPGAGKTMIAERLPGLLPPLTREQALEVTAIHSVLGALPDQVPIEQPPFVAPHHGASMPAVVGGGSGRIRPGAVSRAHRGVMFLDDAVIGVTFVVDVWFGAAVPHCASRCCSRSIRCRLGMEDPAARSVLGT